MDPLASVVGAMDPTMATHPTIKLVPLVWLVAKAEISR